MPVKLSGLAGAGWERALLLAGGRQRRGRPHDGKATRHSHASALGKNYEG